jgi:hypothetical protein
MPFQKYFECFLVEVDIFKVKKWLELAAYFFTALRFM